MIYANFINDIVDGTGMFMSSSITSFTQDMPNLVNGTMMFGKCQSLTEFDADMPKLQNG